MIASPTHSTASVISSVDTSPSPLLRNGYAKLADLKTPSVQALSDRLELAQASFVAKSAPVWNRTLRFSADSLYTWSRQWEYPYVFANLGATSQRILDAGSGMTFFPFFLADVGHQVSCCDNDGSLSRIFEQARSLTGLPVEFQTGSITKLPYADGHFDTVCCVSVLEHVPDRLTAIREFQRVLKPQGQLILTCDVSLDREAAIQYEGFAALVHEILESFDAKYDLCLHRPPDLLTTTSMSQGQPWRLTFGQRRNSLPIRLAKVILGRPSFYHLTVAGFTFVKKVC